MSLNKTLTLNDGNKIPQIGLGTWLSKPGEVENAVEAAIKAGYRHLGKFLSSQSCLAHRFASSI